MAEILFDLFECMRCGEWFRAGAAETDSYDEIVEKAKAAHDALRKNGRLAECAATFEEFRREAA